MPSRQAQGKHDPFVLKQAKTSVCLLIILNAKCEVVAIVATNKKKGHELRKKMVQGRGLEGDSEVGRIRY